MILELLGVMVLGFVVLGLWDVIDFVLKNKSCKV